MVRFPLRVSKKKKFSNKKENRLPRRREEPRGAGEKVKSILEKAPLKENDLGRGKCRINARRGKVVSWYGGFI